MPGFIALKSPKRRILTWTHATKGQKECEMEDEKASGHLEDHHDQLTKRVLSWPITFNF